MGEAGDEGRDVAHESLSRLLAGLSREVAARLEVPFVAVSVPARTTRILGRDVRLGATHVPYDAAPCVATMEQGGLLALENMDELARFAANPFVAGAPGVRSYLGAPVLGRNREPLGTVCAYDPARRGFDEAARDGMLEFAARVADMIERLNMSEWLLRALDRDQLAGVADHLAVLGYGEVTDYLVSVVYERREGGRLPPAA